MSFSKTFRNALYTAVAAHAVLAAPTLAQEALAQEASPQFIELPAQPLGEALAALGDAYGVDVIVPGRLVREKTSSPIAGSFTPDEAVERILGRSGLSARRSSTGAILVSAQETRAPAPQLSRETAVASSSLRADQIVVTATKTEIDILEAPAAIGVVTREKIIAQGAQTAVEALQGEPGVRISYFTEGNFPVIQIRSAGDTGQFQNTDVLLLIDGVPQVNLNDQSIYDQIPFEAVDRVEVVRGPTSALYGRNGVGGTINIITRDAPDEFEASGTFTAGSFGFVKPRLTMGGAVSDNVNVLVSGSYETVDGWRDDTERQAIDLFAKADIDLSPRTRLTLTAQYFDLEQNVPTIFPLLPDGSEIPGIAVTDSFNIPGAQARNESLQLAAVLSHDFSDTLSFTAPIYYRRTDRILEREGSFIDNINTDDQTFDLFPFTPTSEESIIGVRPQLTWTPAQRVEIVAGGDFERNDAQAGASNTVPPGGGPFDPITVNYATGAFSVDPSAFEEIVRRDGDFQSTVWALYAQARIGLTDRLRLTLGGRYDRQERSLEDSLRPNPSVQASYDRFTPRAALDYAFTDDVHGYASYSEGFNPPFGGAFSFEREGADELEPEVARNYELGLKANVADGRGFVSLAGFFLERRDLVQTLRDQGVNTQINAGGLDVWGIELDGAIDLGGGFSASGNYSYTETEWQEFTVRDVSFAGFEVIQNPNHLASASLDWASADGRFQIGAWVDYVGERFADRSNTVSIDDYTLANLQAAYRPWGDDRLTVRVQGFNLLDQEYLPRTELDFLGNVLGGSPGRPANFLASINVRY